MVKFFFKVYVLSIDLFFYLKNEIIEIKIMIEVIVLVCFILFLILLYLIYKYFKIIYFNFIYFCFF